MRVYKAGKKFIAMHTKGNTVYSAQGNSEENAKDRVFEMINKKQHGLQSNNQKQLNLLNLIEDEKTICTQ